MAKKVEDCEPGFELVVFQGITVSLPFTYSSPDSTPVDLTGKEIVFKWKFGTTITEYTSTPNSFGSVVTITSAVDGEFLVLITDEETTELALGSGRWWVELHDGGNVDLLWRDDVIVKEI